MASAPTSVAVRSTYADKPFLFVWLYECAVFVALHAISTRARRASR